MDVLIRREGHDVNLKRTYRIYRDAGLQVRRRKRKRHRVERVHEIFESQAPNQRWSKHFAHYAPSRGRRMRMLTVVGDHTKHCLWIEVDSSISGYSVSRILDNLVELYGKPERIQSDNGPEFAGVAHAREIEEDWRVDYNEVSPHYRLNQKTPE